MPKRLVETKEQYDKRAATFLTCSECNTAKEDAEETTCPFAKEIYNVVVETVLCGNCYTQRCESI